MHSEKMKGSYIKAYVWKSFRMASRNFITIYIEILAPPHVKFRPGVKFSVSTRVEKNWCHTWVSTHDKTNIFYFISPGVKLYLQRFAAYFTKMLYGKRRFVCRLQDYIKTTMLDFINKISSMFNFKTFKIVLLTAIDSKIVAASLY